MRPTSTRRPTAERHTVEETVRPSSGGCRSALSPGVRPEHTGGRPSHFSTWHRRALPGWAFSCDIDCLEIRSGRGIVGAIETGEIDGLPTEARLRAIAKKKGIQLGALQEIGAALHIPCFFILVSRTLARAAVLDLRTDQVREMTEAELAAIIEEL